MRVTPLEIRQKTFEKKLRGYDTQEVDAFLQSLSHEWERLLDELRDQKFKLEQVEREYAKLKEVENSLYKTLKAAEETGANMLEQAKTEAASIQKDAQIFAASITADAERQARKKLEEADDVLKNAVYNSQNQLNGLITEIRKLEDQKANFLLESQNMVKGFLDLLQKESTEAKKLDISLPSNLIQESLESLEKTIIPSVKTPTLAVEEKEEEKITLPTPEPAIVSAPVETKPKEEKKVLTFFDQIQDV